MDGDLHDFWSCAPAFLGTQFPPSMWNAERHTACLSNDQIQTLHLAYTGPVNSQSNALFDTIANHSTKEDSLIFSIDYDLG